MDFTLNLNVIYFIAIYLWFSYSFYKLFRNWDRSASLCARVISCFLWPLWLVFYGILGPDNVAASESIRAAIADTRRRKAQQKAVARKNNKKKRR